MYQITLEIPDELANELQPHHSHLLELLRLGLAEWSKTQRADNQLAIERVLQQMADKGVLIQPQPYPANYCPPERTLIQVTGQPISEIVIEQRNRPA